MFVERENMASSAKASLAAELSIPGVKIQILDYYWSAGERITENYQNYLLSYRSYPNQVSISAKTPEKNLNFGKLFFFPPGMSIKTDAASRDEKVRAILCGFDPDWFGRIWKTSSAEWDSERLSRSFDIHSTRIEQAIQRLGMEALNPGYASHQMVDALSNLIAVEIARYLRNPPEDLRVRTRQGVMSEADLQRIYEYVTNFENKRSNVEEIARLCNISAAHLRRSFKKATGQTVYDYVEGVRLEKMKGLLVETDLPLKEISYRIGFANHSTLSSTFKRMTGETPSEYRHRHRN